MSNTNTGGPAFPSTEPSQEHTPFFAHYEGMTLRDYFAAKAMQGATTRGWSPGKTMDAVAQDCYLMADAMLKARNE